MRGHNDICVIESNPGGKKTGERLVTLVCRIGKRDWTQRNEF